MRTKTHRDLERFMRIAKYRKRINEILQKQESEGSLTLWHIEKATEVLASCDAYILNNKKAMGYHPMQRISV